MKIRRDIKLLGLMVTSSIIFGCATTQNHKEDVQKVADEQLEKKAMVYRDKVTSAPLKEMRVSQCPSSLNSLKAKWNWQEAVDASGACLRAENFVRLEELAGMLSSHEPSAPWGPFYYSVVAENKKQLDRAAWMSELAVKRAPSVGLVHYQKAKVLLQKGDFSGAVQSFEKSVELDQNLLPAHLFLGRIYYRDQEYDAALKHFYSVVKADSRNTEALTGLGECQLLDKNPRGAMDAFSRLSEMHPEDGYYLRRIGEIYESNLNDQASALSVYRTLKEKQVAGRIKKNWDKDLDSKIKSLEGVSKTERAPASRPSKAGGNQK